MRTTLPLIAAYAANTASKIVVLICITRLGGLEVAGQYSLALSVVTPTFLLAGLSLRQLYVTSPGGVGYVTFLRLRFVFGAVGVVIAAAVAMTGAFGAPGVLVAMAAYRFSEMLVDMNVADFQRRERIVPMASSLFGFAVLTAGALLVAYWVAGSLVVGLLAAAGVGLVIFGVTYLTGPARIRSEEMQTGQSAPAREIVRDGLTLASSSFMTSLGANLPVMLLASHASLSAVGAFSAIYNLSAISNVLYTSVADAELRKFAKYARAREWRTLVSAGSRVAWPLCGIAIIAAVGLYFFGAPIFTAVFGQDFSGYVVTMMIIAATICVAPFGYMTDVQLTALQMFRTQSILSAVSLTLTAGLGLALIPLHGVNGCALVILLVMLTRNMVKSLAIRRATRGRPS